MGETMRISRLAVLALTLPASAPPHPAELAYRVRVDANALSRIDVTLRIPDAPGTVRLAMAAHPEYDDRFWRQVVDLGAERGGRPVPVVRPCVLKLLTEVNGVIRLIALALAEPKFRVGTPF